MVLLTLASAQFLMTLDSSVMNVSIATVPNPAIGPGHYAWLRVWNAALPPDVDRRGG
jgi:hypothetical protein